MGEYIKKSDLKAELLRRDFYPAIVKNALETIPPADVVPRAMIAEIFGEMKKAIKEEVRDYCNSFEKAETHEFQEYFKTKQNTAIFLYMKIDHLEKKYTEGGE